MRVQWLEKPLKNLVDEGHYIALENPKATDDFSDAIFASVDKLAQFPALGREGRVKNTREWAVPNWSYLIPYRVRGDRLQILGVLHTATPTFEVVVSRKNTATALNQPDIPLQTPSEHP